MKILSKVSIFTFCTLAYLTGCSTDEGDDFISGSNTSVDGPQETKVNVVSGCEEITDDADKATIEQIKTNLTDVFSSFGEGDLNKTQELSSTTKSSIEAILKKYPGNCEAQLAYAAAIISDVVNNKKINNFLDTLAARQGKTKYDLFTKDIDDAAELTFNYTINSSDDIRNILVSDVQSAIGSAIPSLDSAISFMTNIANDDEFTCTYFINDRDIELDRGDFAPVLAAMYVAKASLTALVSINLNIDENGKYDWIDSLEELEYRFNYYSNHGIEHLLKFIGKDSKFTSIHNSWKKEFKNIPNLLDSAITYVQLGLQYGLEEAKTGMETQENDLYIVGDGEEAHLSTADAQKIIDSLTTIRKQLHEGFDIEYAKGKTIKINVSKLFENTDGIQKFLPYHVVNDKSEWVNPDGGFYWSEDFEYQAYAQRYMQGHVGETYHKFKPSARDIMVYSHDEDVSTGYVYLEVYDPYEKSKIRYNVDGCKISFTFVFFDASIPNLADTIPLEKAPWSIPDLTIPNGMCKEDKGTIKYAVAFYENEVPNFGYFTDKDGKKTETIQGLLNGKMVDTEIEKYKFEDLRNIIIFPDVTFGGIFPNMTEDIFWNEFVKSIIDDDFDEYYEDEEDWDDDEYDY